MYYMAKITVEKDRTTMINYQSLSRIIPKSIRGQITRVMPRSLRHQIYKRINPAWYMASVGGMWDEIGRHQFKYLVDEGLTPDSYFLDVGCGSLRGGIHFIEYLDEGHYYGIDVSKELLDAGRNLVLERHNLTDKHPVLMLTGDFDFPLLNRECDFALAQSVFTHIPVDAIRTCLENMDKVLVDGGKFYASFRKASEGSDEGLAYYKTPGGLNSTIYYDPSAYQYRFSTFEKLCVGTGLTAHYVGEWGHPRGSQMAVFVKGGNRLQA